MGSRKVLSEKKVLSKEARHTRWAPFWVVLKKFARGRQVHPSRFTAIKRDWHRTKIKD